MQYTAGLPCIPHDTCVRKVVRSQLKHCQRLPVSGDIKTVQDTSVICCHKPASLGTNGYPHKLQPSPTAGEAHPGVAYPQKQPVQ